MNRFQLIQIGILFLYHIISVQERVQAISLDHKTASKNEKLEILKEEEREIESLLKEEGILLPEKAELKPSSTSANVTPLATPISRKATSKESYAISSTKSPLVNDKVNDPTRDSSKVSENRGRNGKLKPNDSSKSVPMLSPPLGLHKTAQAKNSTSTVAINSTASENSKSQQLNNNQQPTSDRQNEAKVLKAPKQLSDANLFETIPSFMSTSTTKKPKNNGKISPSKINDLIPIKPKKIHFNALFEHSIQIQGFPNVNSRQYPRYSKVTIPGVHDSTNQPRNINKFELDFELLAPRAPQNSSIWGNNLQKQSYYNILQDYSNKVYDNAQEMPYPSASQTDLASLSVLQNSPQNPLPLIAPPIESNEIPPMIFNDDHQFLRGGLSNDHHNFHFLHRLMEAGPETFMPLNPPSVNHHQQTNTYPLSMVQPRTNTELNLQDWRSLLKSIKSESCSKKKTQSNLEGLPQPGGSSKPIEHHLPLHREVIHSLSLLPLSTSGLRFQPVESGRSYGGMPLVHYPLQSQLVGDNHRVLVQQPSLAVDKQRIQLQPPTIEDYQRFLLQQQPLELSEVDDNQRFIVQQQPLELSVVDDKRFILKQQPLELSVVDDNQRFLLHQQQPLQAPLSQIPESSSDTQNINPTQFQFQSHERFPNGVMLVTK